MDDSSLSMWMRALIGYVRSGEPDLTPHATGTGEAFGPVGALERAGRRARSGGDYDAWTPEG